MALEVNTMKQKSVQLFSKSQKKQRALAEQISLDRYMDQQGQIEEVQKIQEKYVEQIKGESDANQRVKLYKLMALEQFKAIMKLDRHNEIHPSKKQREVAPQSLTIDTKNRDLPKIE